MRFFVPQGIGDSLWSIMLVESIRDHECPGDPIDITINCGDLNTVETRALDFVRAFSFVRSAEMVKASILHPQKPFTDQNGFANYAVNGWNKERTIFTLIPNAWLDRGKRLEEGMPEYQVNWGVMDSFRFGFQDTLKFLALLRILEQAGKRLCYCVFHPGPLRGNIAGGEGHNRGPIWTPEDWATLTQAAIDSGVVPVLVGAPYDVEYQEQKLAPALKKVSGPWVDLIGTTSVAECLLICRHAQFVISYQDGIGITSSTMGVRTALWWRKQGDSMSPYTFFTSHDNMKNGWANPEHIERGSHLGLTYGEQTADELVAEIRKRNWL